ncbi:MAG: polysaccharide pyruvyl transferase family protein, partial [Fervidobacterium sp.]
KEIATVLGYKPKVNVDPTLLLDSKQWSEIAKPPKQDIEKPYMFVYDLYRSNDILPIVEKLAKKENINNYVNYTPILFARKIRNPHLKFTCYTEGPAEFLHILKESDFVITSSFHGVIFSIIFEKPFYAILWDRKDTIKQNDRITDLLNKIGLIDRCFTNPKDILKRGLDKNINWQTVRAKLNQLRQDSMNWLLNALKDALTNKTHLKIKSNVSVVKNCTGCFACYSICPNNAIEMKFSGEGFYVPNIKDDLCMHCGFCLDVCPIMNAPSEKDRYLTPKTYVAWSLDEKTRLNSSSGGLYPELAKLTLEDNGVVFAVGWNEEWLPEHRQVSNLDEIAQTVGSKYVQSKVGNVYRKIIELTRDNKKVLFVGTPCQVAGLRNIVKQMMVHNILLIDLVCLGVSSPAVFKKYIDETFERDKITSISFRSKVKGWSRPSFV